MCMCAAQRDRGITRMEAWECFLAIFKQPGASPLDRYYIINARAWRFNLRLGMGAESKRGECVCCVCGDVFLIGPAIFAASLQKIKSLFFSNEHFESIILFPRTQRVTETPRTIARA
jgi:hypothetical protein